jgi:protein TonB
MLPRAARADGVDDEDALANYALILQRELARVVRPDLDYPRIARQKGWQGRAVISFQFDASGKLVEAAISKGSGYEILDERALGLVRRMKIPQVPAGLRARSFTTHVPVQFTLKDSSVEFR